jgi:hypothetical protein
VHVRYDRSGAVELGIASNSTWPNPGSEYVLVGGGCWEAFSLTRLQFLDLTKDQCPDKPTKSDPISVRTFLNIRRPRDAPFDLFFVLKSSLTRKSLVQPIPEICIPKGIFSG